MAFCLSSWRLTTIDTLIKFIIMETKVLALPKDAVLKDMELWNNGKHSVYADFDTLWQMFRGVLASGSYGTSEFGGPIWLLDFSLANLKKLFPENPWLDTMEQDKSKALATGKSKNFNKFFEWFRFRAECMVKFCGLGNVIIKYETISGVNVALYGWGVFLDTVQSFVDGSVRRLSLGLMMKWNYSLRESEAVRKGEFFTCLNTDSMVKQYPNASEDADDVKHSDVYGDCYHLKHFSPITGYVIPETVSEKILTLVVNDLMEYMAQRLSNEPDRSGLICPYPMMKYDKYLDGIGRCGYHFKPTAEVFRWRRNDGCIEEIKVELPKIEEKYGEFWHRQFPLKQNWRELKG